MLAYAFSLMDLFTASFLILAFMLISRITSVRQISKTLDLELPIMLVSALSLGVALTKSGAANLLAMGFVEMLSSFGSKGIFIGLFLATTVLTAFVTNVAAVTIAFPIALSIANTLGADPTPFFVGIAFAASGEFMTPMGYQTNLMVFGPGGYKFKDYLKVGTPLNILYALVSIIFILWVYRV
jgi:di/tricarboxylate transporter